MAKKRDDKASFLTECKEHILKHAGPFVDFSDEAAAELDDYLTAELIALKKGGKQRSRYKWSLSAEFKKQFFRRLALVGEKAKDAGLVRMDTAAETGEATPDVGVLHASDLQAAEQKVAKISFTSGCTPDDPDDP